MLMRKNFYSYTLARKLSTKFNIPAHFILIIYIKFIIYFLWFLYILYILTIKCIILKYPRVEIYMQLAKD